MWRIQPGGLLSEGQGVVLGNGGRAQDDAPVLRVLLEHLLGLLSAHVKETAAGVEDGEEHDCAAAAESADVKTGNGTHSGIAGTLGFSLFGRGGRGGRDSGGVLLLSRARISSSFII